MICPSQALSQAQKSCRKLSQADYATHGYPCRVRVVSCRKASRRIPITLELTTLRFPPRLISHGQRSRELGAKSRPRHLTFNHYRLTIDFEAEPANPSPLVLVGKLTSLAPKAAVAGARSTDPRRPEINRRAPDSACRRDITRDMAPARASYTRKIQHSRGRFWPGRVNARLSAGLRNESFHG